MDLDRLRKVQSARSEQIEATIAGLPEAQQEQVEELKDRFKLLAERLTKYVQHDHYSYPRENGLSERVSPARHIGKFEGPMPEVSLRFRYFYNLDDHTASSHRGGVGFNEYDENIRKIQMEFIHSPAGVTAEPIRAESLSRVPALPLEYGEIFATESLSFSDLRSLENAHLDHGGIERLHGYHPSVVLTLLEQSMDQYEAAPASPHEAKEDLAAKLT